MNRSKYIYGILAMACALALAAPAMAQTIMRMDGQVFDLEGKPFPGVGVIIKSEQGQTWETKTDDKGNFTQGGLRAGVYYITFKVKDQQVYEMNWRLQSGDDRRIVVNFKEIAAKQSGAAAEAMKKQEEARNKFESMKASFDQGMASLQQARSMNEEIRKAPTDAALKQKKAELIQSAITSMETAEQGLDPADEARHIVLANLGGAYKEGAQWDKAAEAYKKAIAATPAAKPQPAYHVELGTVLAHAGKVDEATASCDQVAVLDKPNAAMCYRNLGIVLYNTNKLKEAVTPLRKATELDATNADAFYLLGASLVAAMESKKVGDKLEFVVQPGTAEAYQKYLELAPTGRFAAEAKAGLEMLESLGHGVQTKVRTGKKRPN